MSKILTPLLVLVVAVLAVALFLRGGQVLYAIASWNTSQTTITLSNSAPTIESPVTCTDDWRNPDTNNVTLIAGAAVTVSSNITVNDLNGGNDYNATTLRGSFYNNGTRTQQNCLNAAESNYNCYRNITCQWVRKNETASYAMCSWRVFFNARNTSVNPNEAWYCWLNFSDKIGAYPISSNNWTNMSVSMNELLAMGAEAQINFGTKVAGVNDSTVGTGCGAGCHDIIYNWGNLRFNMLINASNPMACTAGPGIYPGWLHVNYTDSAPYSQSAPLDAVAVNTRALFSTFLLEPNTTNPTVDQTTYPSSNNTYWGIGIDTGNSGTCTGTVWFLAYAS